MIVKNFQEAAKFAAEGNFEVIPKSFFAEGISHDNFRERYEGYFILKDNRDGFHRVCVKNSAGKLEILFASSVNVFNTPDFHYKEITKGVSCGCYMIQYLGQAASIYDKKPEFKEYNMIRFCYDGLVYASRVLHEKHSKYQNTFICDILDDDSVNTIGKYIAGVMGLPRTAALFHKLPVGDGTLEQKIPQFKMITKIVRMKNSGK